MSLAIDERAEHPIGVLKAEYGHLLMMVTVLHEKPDGDPALPPPPNARGRRLPRARVEGRAGDAQLEDGQPPTPLRPGVPHGDHPVRRDWCVVRSLGQARGWRTGLVCRCRARWESQVEYLGDTHAVFAGRETGTYTDPENTVVPLRIRTTRYFRYEQGRWQQYHHHGSIDDPAALRAYQHAVTG